MRGWWLLAAAAAAAGVMAVPATSAPPHLSVQGAGWVAFPNFPAQGETTLEHFAVSARLDPDGAPQGTIVQHSPFGDVHADVTCLVQADERTIYVGGRITRGFTYLGLDVSHLALGIRDNGNGEEVPDLVAGAIFVAGPSRPPEFDACGPLVPFPPVFEVVRGDFAVGGSPGDD